MHITGNIDPDSNLLQKPISRKQVNRKSRSPGFSGCGVQLNWEGDPAAGKRGSRLETPLLKWKFSNGKEEKDDDIYWRSRRKVRDVSARKLAAGLWRLQPLESSVDSSGELCSVPKSNGFEFQLEPKLHFSNSAMEGATKWDPGSRKPSQGLASTVPMLESELDQARARIHELETDRRSSKKKLEQFLKKLNEERSIWRRREREKIRLVIDDVKHELNTERKNRNRIKIANSKLASELAESKSLKTRYLQDYEKERKARELMEEICDELAKEIGKEKAEVEGLKREMVKMREEVDEEKKLLQMAEVWREEHVQMKLVDTKVTLEDKYSHMNKLVKDLEAFLNLKGANLDYEEMKRAEMIQRSAGLINIPNPADSNPELVCFDEDDDESGWETVSHVEVGSSHSANGSGSISETSEVGLVQSKQTKKVSSTVLSLDHGSAKSGVTSPDWGSESGDLRVNRGVKGCAKWPRGFVQKNSLKAKLLEARMESQKVQLCQVMEQKI